jgi:adenylate kinase family enzyme
MVLYGMRKFRIPKENLMSKIYIVGIVASGKTTLAKKLSKQSNIPYYELDCVIHHKTALGRYKRTPEQQVEVLKSIDHEEDWIIEGTYRESCHCLLDMADKIIFLDTPLWKRNYRIFLRYIKQRLRLEKCHYKSDFKMLKLMYKWTKEFEQNRVSFEQMLNQYENKLLVIKNANQLPHHKL